MGDIKWPKVVVHTIIGGLLLCAGVWWFLHFPTDSVAVLPGVWIFVAGEGTIAYPILLIVIARDQDRQG